jgi:hypothetical protein
MSNSAYAPFNTSYGQTQPYLTTTEYQNAPTAIDTSNLLPSGSTASQTEALAEVIGRASSLIDAECLGAWGTLNATVNTENARVWGNNANQFVIHPKYWPILEVQSFQFGFTPSNLTSITPAGSIWVEPSQFVVMPSGVVGLGLNSLAGIVPRSQYFAQWTYVNGWPNTPLSASVAAGAASITPSSVIGIYPGTNLTLFDAPNDEQITVASSYVPGVSTVPLTAPLAYSHQAGAVVTNLPKAAKQGAISLTTCLIKVRGSGALIASDIGEVRQTAQGNPQGAMSDYDMALDCIRSLRQMFVGY